MKTFYLWQIVKLARMPIVLAVIPLFLIGVLFAWRTGAKFSVSNFLWGFSILFLIEIAASFANDYFDYHADKHNRQFGFSGGSGVLLKYPELRKMTKWLAFLFILISLLFTILLSFFTYIPIWSVAYIAIGGFFSWFYSSPPLRFSYRGFSEIPHFVAGIMNAGWGYLLIAGTINLNIIIFAIPLSLHLLNVIFIFELPDREADINGGKKNFIVKYGRQKSFLLISIIFWIATIYFIFLAILGWFSDIINFWLLALISLLPSIVSTYNYMIKPFEQKLATKYAIRTAISLFFISISISVYFIYLQF